VKSTSSVFQDNRPSSESIDRVCLDFDDLVEEGHFSRSDSFWPHDEQQPVIIVTEGKSDARILQDCLNLLRSDLAPFFSFVNFETANARGGTAELVQFVRMFVGCGIRNRIVVLFDNDTAGHEALASLSETDLPANVFTIALPALALARSYPTLGPDGASLADINERACALELYFGEDILRDDNGELRPIRWTGFNDKMKRYQGAITGKSVVQDRFRQKIEEARRATRRTPDFSGISLIIDAILEKVAER